MNYDHEAGAFQTQMMDRKKAPVAAGQPARWRGPWGAGDVVGGNSLQCSVPQGRKCGGIQQGPLNNFKCEDKMI